VSDPAARAKEAAARAAVDRTVRAGERVALGTGSTAAFAVRRIAERFPGAALDLVASSRATEALATGLGLVVRPLAAGDRFDRMLDGADEVTPALALTKGGGGALLREKLLAHLSREVVILVDPAKLVRALGERSPIPVEVVPVAAGSLARELAEEGFRVDHRRAADGRPFVTDNGNEILDLVPRTPIEDPARVAAALKARVGVVESGIFIGLAHRLFVGRDDGTFDERRPA
jgi:ribose 5-phosphate isomerase A